MIFVDGVSFPSQSPSSQEGRSLETCSSKPESDLLNALIEHSIPGTNAFKATPLQKFSDSEQPGPERSTESKVVYVFQREFATVDPALVNYIGTDEATTCVGLVIRNNETKAISVAHMDSPNIVEAGLSQMLLTLLDPNPDVAFDVHLIGGFEDVTHGNGESNSGSKKQKKIEGFSLPLCSKIMECLSTRREKFHLQTLCVLRHNTVRDSKGNSYPIFNGFVVSTSDGCIIPATFDSSSRSPDEIVRRIRVTSCYEDPHWNGKLLETYETQTDEFKISPTRWSSRQRYIALRLQDLSDSEILLMCSSSPFAEGPDFVPNMRRVWDYLIEHPDWREAFPLMKPRSFKRTSNGGWERDNVVAYGIGDRRLDIDCLTSYIFL